MKEFKYFLNKVFDPKPSPDLIEAMFERFKPFKLKGERENIHCPGEKEMEFLDYIIAMNLLARVV